MKIIIISLLCWSLVSIGSFAQSLSNIKGIVVDGSSVEPIKEVSVSLIGTSSYVITDSKGGFDFRNIPTGEQIIQFQHKDYLSQSYPIKMIEGEGINLGQILLSIKVITQSDLSVILLSDEELSDDEGGADNTAGLLHSSKDVFLNAAAYEFSSTFFKARGYNSRYGKVLINGTEMNKIFNGRPQWSNLIIVNTLL